MNLYINLTTQIPDTYPILPSIDEPTLKLKGPVSSSIDMAQGKDGNLWKQGKELSKKALWQKKFWSISSNQKQPQNEQNFITLSQISEMEKIKIIQTGFRLNQEGKISLKKYYESPEEYSLFHLKGYSIKYESIRRTKLYQKLKA